MFVRSHGVNQSRRRPPGFPAAAQPDRQRNCGCADRPDNARSAPRDSTPAPRPYSPARSAIAAPSSRSKSALSAAVNDFSAREPQCWREQPLLGAIRPAGAPADGSAQNRLLPQTAILPAPESQLAAPSQFEIAPRDEKITAGQPNFSARIQRAPADASGSFSAAFQTLFTACVSSASCTRVVDQLVELLCVLALFSVAHLRPFSDPRPCATRPVRAAISSGPTFWRNIQRSAGQCRQTLLKPATIARVSPRRSI